MRTNIQLPLLVWTVLAVTGILVDARSAVAQSGALIDGVVRDEHSAVLPHATVSFRNQDTGFERVAATESDGRYRFGALPPGTYTLKVELPGFAAAVVHDIVLTIGQQLRRDVTLNVPTLVETIAVTDLSPVVNATHAEVAGLVTSEQMHTLPINSRQFLNVALLMPGTSQDAARPFYNNVTIGAGGSFYSNAFLVDGVTNTWAEQGEPRQNFPQAAVREFKVHTAQFKAENGLATGGMVAVVTKSGTNQLHGELFEYFRAKALNAKNYFEKQLNQPKPNFRRHQFGGSIGGPIVHDRMHYFGAIERTVTDEFFTVNTGRPEFYSAVEGTFRKPSHTNLYLGRLDVQLGQSQSLFARYAQEDEKRTCFNCGGTAAANAGFDQSIPRRAAVFGHTWVQSVRRLNEFRFHYAYAMYQIAPAGTPIFTRIGDYNRDRISPQRIQRGLVFPSLTYGGNFDQLGPEDRWQVKDEYSISFGSHHVKVGGDFSYIPFMDDSPGNLNGQYTFGSDQPFNPNDAASVAQLQNAILYTQRDIPVHDSMPTYHVAAFVQDDWSLRSNLTLSLGVRYDVQICSFNECSAVEESLAQKPRPLPFVNLDRRGDWNNIGPRIGAVWDIVGNNRTVIRGGYGLSYDNIRTLVNIAAEPRSLRSRTIVISNPTYPDPFQGRDPLLFISTAPPNIQILSNDFVNPYGHTFNAGISRSLAGDYSIGVDSVYTRVRADGKNFDRNARSSPTGTGPRPDSAFGRIDEWQSTSSSNYRALYVRVDKRMSGRHQFLLSYTLAKAEDNGPGNRWVNQFAMDDDFGPSNIDRRHTVVASGVVLLPSNVQFSAVWTLRSSLPFNARAGVDLNGDGFSGEPWGDYVPGTTRNQGNRDLDLSLVNAWRAQNGRPSIPKSQIDSARFNSVDVRVSRQFPIGSARLEPMAQVFNLFNTTNLLQPFTSAQVTNALSDSFGRILTAHPGTQAEIAVRLSW